MLFTIVLYYESKLEYYIHEIIHLGTVLCPCNTLPTNKVQQLTETRRTRDFLIL